MPLLIDQVRLHASSYFEPLRPVFEQGSFPYIELKIHEREREGGTVDPLARRAAAEVPLMLQGEEPDLYGACIALELAASREPEIFGPTYELMREFVMRAFLGVARGTGIVEPETEFDTERGEPDRGHQHWAGPMC